MVERIATACPVCSGVIEIVHPHQGMQVECPDCNELFAVVSLRPLELAYALDSEEMDIAEDEEASRT